MMKKRTLWILGIGFCIAVVCMVIFAILVRDKYTYRPNPDDPTAPPVIADMAITLLHLPERTLLDSSDTINIIGECNFKSVVIFIDDKKFDLAKVRNRMFHYELDPCQLEPGWHLISVDQPNYSADSKTRQLFGWLHIIPGQAHVLLPHSDVLEARSYNNRSNRSYQNDRVEGYTPAGRYFGFNLGQYAISEALHFDEQGIPMALTNTGAYVYNPTTISQYAFALYNSIEEDPKNREAFLQVATWLTQHQQADGSFPYDYEFAYKSDLIVPEGFVSGMGQGQLLSVYARAYLLTNSPEYLQAGQKCLEFMIRPADSPQGGTAVTLKDFTDQSPALKPYENYVLFEEYVVKPETYVLNGNLFALIGLYDWWKSVPQDAGAELAHEAFGKGCQAIEVLLPYYDYNGYSAYDLLPYTSHYAPYFSSSYAHCCHIYLLHTLAEVTEKETFFEYYLRFKSYSDDAFYKQTKTLLNVANTAGG